MQDVEDLEGGREFGPSVIKSSVFLIVSIFGPQPSFLSISEKRSKHYIVRSVQV